MELGRGKYVLTEVIDSKSPWLFKSDSGQMRSLKVTRGQIHPSDLDLFLSISYCFSFGNKTDSDRLRMKYFLTNRWYDSNLCCSLPLRNWRNKVILFRVGIGLLGFLFLFDRCTYADDVTGYRTRRSFGFEIR